MNACLSDNCGYRPHFSQVHFIFSNSAGLSLSLFFTSSFGASRSRLPNQIPLNSAILPRKVTERVRITPSKTSLKNSLTSQSFSGCEYLRGPELSM
jgi:hypothetical protein